MTNPIEPSPYCVSVKPDWNVIRRDFPILDQQLPELTADSADPKKSRLAYLDSAASSQIPLQTLERISYHQITDHSNVHRGVHTLSLRATDAVEHTRKLVAKMIGATDPAECIFVRGATEGINLVAHTLRYRFKKGDNVVLSTMEHHSNIVPWYMLKQELGIEIRVVDIQDDATPIAPEEVAKLVDERTVYVGCIHVSNTLGTINDVQTITAAVKEKNPNTLILIDGCQAALHLKIDVSSLGADFYTFSAHKMCAPTGIGILWGRKKLLRELPPFMGGGDMILSVAWDEIRYADIPYKFEAGTPAILPIIGLGESIHYLTSIKGAIGQRERELGEYFFEEVSKINRLNVLGPTDFDHRVSTFSLVFEGVHPHDVGTILSQYGVAIRAGHHCTQPLMRRLSLPATARASLAFYNNKDDIDQFIYAAKKVREIFQ